MLMIPLLALALSPEQLNCFIATDTSSCSFETASDEPSVHDLLLEPAPSGLFRVDVLPTPAVVQLDTATVEELDPETTPEQIQLEALGSASVMVGDETILTPASAQRPD